MFNANRLNVTDQIRLLTGDIEDPSLFEDSVYEFTYLKTGNNEILTAIQMLENIITYLTVSPSSNKFGSVSTSTLNLRDLEGRLIKLKAQLTNKGGCVRVPMMIKNSRDGWSEFNKLYGK